MNTEIYNFSNNPEWAVFFLYHNDDGDKIVVHLLSGKPSLTAYENVIGIEKIKNGHDAVEELIKTKQNEK